MGTPPIALLHPPKLSDDNGHVRYVPLLPTLDVPFVRDFPMNEHSADM